MKELRVCDAKDEASDYGAGKLCLSAWVGILGTLFPAQSPAKAPARQLMALSHQSSCSLCGRANGLLDSFLALAWPGRWISSFSQPFA